MKIRMKDGNIRDVSPDVGDVMVAAGLVEALTPQEANDYVMRKGEPLPYHDLNWHTRPGQYDNGYIWPPDLIWRCQTCAQHTIDAPPAGTHKQIGRDKNGKAILAKEITPPAANWVFHFGKQECPEDVYKQYLALVEAWLKNGNACLTTTQFERVLQSESDKQADATRDARISKLQGLDALKNGRVVTL